MFPKSFRFIAMLVLVAVISMFTGLETVVSAAPVTKVEKSCCGDCGQDGDQDGPASQSVPHSAPCCPAVMCLSFDVAKPIAFLVVYSETIPSFFTFIPDPIPDPFIKSIFHPPSLV